jgi:GntR family transcriptional regulator
MTGDKDEDRGSAERPVPSIEFHLDLTSGVPTFMQIVQQVEHALRLGYLSVGDQLPRVRDVVAELAINPNTVMKAYRELEMKGLAVGRPGQGTFIEATLNQVALPVLVELRRSLVSWVTDADAAGLDENGIAALIANVMRDFRDGGAKVERQRGTTRPNTEGVA